MKKETELSPSHQPKSLRELMSIGSAIRDSIANEQEFNPEVLNYLGITKEDTEVMLTDKVDAIAFVLDDLESMADQLKQRAKTISDAAKRFENAHDRLKEYLKGSMEHFGFDEVSGTDQRFKLSPCAMRLVITNEAVLPEFYTVTTIVKTPNKELIKKSLENLEKVTGAELQSGTALKQYVVKPKSKKDKK